MNQPWIEPLHAWMNQPWIEPGLLGYNGSILALMYVVF